MPLDINRRIAALVGEQQQLSEAAVYDAEQVRLFLFGRAVQLYRTLQELQGNHYALRPQLKALEKNYLVVETEIDVGRAPRVELLRIDAERKSVEGQLAALDGQEIDLPNRPFGLPDGAHLSARIIVQQVADAIVIPRAALVPSLSKVDRIVFKLTDAAHPARVLAITAAPESGLDLAQVRTIVAHDLRDTLLNLPGVAEAEVLCCRPFATPSS